MPKGSELMTPVSTAGIIRERPAAGYQTVASAPRASPCPGPGTQKRVEQPYRKGH